MFLINKYCKSEYNILSNIHTNVCWMFTNAFFICNFLNFCKYFQITAWMSNDFDCVLQSWHFFLPVSWNNISFLFCKRYVVRMLLHLRHLQWCLKSGSLNSQTDWVSKQTTLDASRNCIQTSRQFYPDRGEHIHIQYGNMCVSNFAPTYTIFAIQDYSYDKNDLSLVLHEKK